MSDKKEKRGVFKVAAEAGVSIATVSRAFNEPERVRDEVRTKILNVAQRLGYVPNSSAKALRLQRTYMVGAIIPTLDHAIYAKLVNSFQARLSEFGYTVVVLSVGFDNTNIGDGVKRIVQRGAEALMVVGSIKDVSLKAFLEANQTPIVQTYSYTHDINEPCVGFDNAAAIQKIVQYVISLGHRDIALIAGRAKGNDRQESRINAFKDTLNKAGLSPGPVFERPYALSEGASAMHEILDRHKNITATICGSDILAFGSIAACQSRGVEIPRDMSITGFDDLDFAGLLRPSLTTVAIAADEMGTTAAERLVSALEEKQPVTPQLFETNLVIRNSTAAPPKASKNKLSKV